MTIHNRIHQRITVKKARELMNRDPLHIYDLRDEESFARGHIPGAVCLSWRDLERVVLGSSKMEPVLIYCYHGNASQTGAQTFHDFGFLEIYDLIGGYQRWLQETQGSEVKNNTSTEHSKESGHDRPASNR